MTSTIGPIKRRDTADIFIQIERVRSCNCLIRRRTRVADTGVTIAERRADISNSASLKTGGERLLFVSAIEPVKSYLKRVTVVESTTGEIAGVLTFGDSVSDRHIRMMAPSLVNKTKKKRK